MSAPVCTHTAQVCDVYEDTRLASILNIIVKILYICTYSIAIYNHFFFLCKLKVNHMMELQIVHLLYSWTGRDHEQRGHQQRAVFHLPTEHRDSESCTHMWLYFEWVICWLPKWALSLISVMRDIAVDRWVMRLNHADDSTTMSNMPIRCFCTACPTLHRFYLVWRLIPHKDVTLQ
jgi:hypothetical protein